METCNSNFTATKIKPIYEVEKSLIKTYRKDIYRNFVKALDDFNLIQSGDKIGVAISGGKDSLLLAKLFQEIKRHNKMPFELEFIVMDPGFSKNNVDLLIENAKMLKIPIKIKKSNNFSILEKIAKENPCYLCARMRRGFLYEFAQELGCNKLALGHHFDDVIETTLLNMFYNGSFKTMVPKIKAENFSNMELIRPLVYIKEKDIIRWANYNNITTMNCGCEVQAEKLSSKRREIKELIKKLKKDNPIIDQMIFTSATNVYIDQIYSYKEQDELIDFNKIYNKNKG